MFSEYSSVIRGLVPQVVSENCLKESPAAHRDVEDTGKFELTSSTGIYAYRNARATQTQDNPSSSHLSSIRNAPRLIIRVHGVLPKSPRWQFCGEHDVQLLIGPAFRLWQPEKCPY